MLFWVLALLRDQDCDFFSSFRWKCLCFQQLIYHPTSQGPYAPRTFLTASTGIPSCPVAFLLFMFTIDSESSVTVKGTVSSGLQMVAPRLNLLEPGVDWFRLLSTLSSSILKCGDFILSERCLSTAHLVRCGSILQSLALWFFNQTVGSPLCDSF